MTSADRPGRPEAPAPGSPIEMQALIVDDHPVVLSGFRHVAEDFGIQRVLEATDTVTGYRLFHRHRPRITVIDLSLQDRDLAGLSLIRRVRALEPEARILAFSMHDDPVIVSRGIECGALGYALKDAPAAHFREAIGAVLQGRSYLEYRLATSVAMLGMQGHARPLGQLSARELQILTLLSKGNSYSAIADRLSVSYRTVISACSSMRQKLGVRTLAELIHVAVSRDKLNVEA